MTQIVILCGYMLLLLILGGVASRLFRGTSQDYMLASHTIGPVLLLLSLFGTTMTAFALVGSTGEAYREGIGVYGMMASSSGIVHSLCFFLIGTRLWSFARRYGYTTQIQFFRDRLESDKIGVLLFPILVGMVVPYVLIGVISSGAVINGVTRGSFPGYFESYGHGVPNWLAALVVCGVVLSYVFFGGMRGTAWANAFQTTVFMVLGVITFYVIAQKLGKQESLLANLRVISEQVPRDKLTRVHVSKIKFLSYMLIPLSVGMFPHVFQHWLTARSAASFKLPVVAHPLFIMIVWAPCVLVGIWATTGLAGVPASLQANNVLAYMVKHLSGDVLGGLLGAGILAAIMSSLDSQFLCMGSMFTNDIVLHYVGKERLSDRQVVLIARLFVVAVVALTYGLSLLEQPNVFKLGEWCFSGFASLFPLVFAAVYWKRLTKLGAYASILTAVLVWIHFFREAQYGLDVQYTYFKMLPVVPMIAASTAAMILVSLVTSPPDERTLAKYFKR